MSLTLKSSVCGGAVTSRSQGTTPKQRAPEVQHSSHRVAANLGSSRNGISKQHAFIAKAARQSHTQRACRMVPSAMGMFGSGAPKRKTVILTGTSSGLGLATFRSLMATGEWHVICGVRDVDKMQSIIDEGGYPRDAYTLIPLDLKSLDSVKSFVKKFRGTGKKLDVLCCNAAIYLPNQPGPTFGDYGYEESLTVNHLSHFLLVNLLLSDLKKAPEPRCIIVGSITGNTNTVGGGAVKPFADLGDLSGLANKSVMVDGKEYDGAKAYKDSKLANMMTVLELHRRYHEETGIVFSSLYPGCIAETNLFRQKRQWFRKLFPVFMKYVTGGYVSEEEAGDRLCEVITSPKCNESGVYWSWNGGARTTGFYNPLKGEVQGAGGSGGEIFKNMPSQEVRNERKGKKLWELSAKAVGLESEVKASV
uniref:NADPH-protochlorophyllide oxidoreductase n=1 Tax=Tetraselmis sp. GSL018 TaxID=582737 RepID=A0A061QVS9_9CHLO|eukprot:CAMPEP_0177610296 /NCGR_PEP_ID=MMETSP0419_2-20121207/19682_1 /TAXON_ID=582737 /ORGANISM="Tetraselmis sp., Strain GSL018" /LENGTH=419 /DNA_ID=CAMNT_0019105549 /DNA_START=36 /DNA_END=1295 /DNA_ORIENTATION=+